MRRAPILRPWGPKLAAISALALLASCGEIPEDTAAARGVISGTNAVLALSIAVVVVAAGLLIAAVGLDRFIRSRKELEGRGEEPDTTPEDEEEEVAGIRQEAGVVPRWLYAAYVVIPVFALFYVFTNVQVASELPDEEVPHETEAPAGPRAEWHVVSEDIAFDVEEIIVPPTTEVEITLENLDTVPHNIAVYQTEDAQDEIFVGEIFNGVATRAYTFTSPEVGEYYFHCDVHPNMNGAFVVAEGEAGDGGGEEGGAGASTQVAIVAASIEFDTDEFSLVANTPVQIEFTNEDTVPHNVAIYTSEGRTEEIFIGDIFTGPATRTYEFTSPDPGEYYFVCDVHPNMDGTVHVE